jgi:hypothetical protein
MISAILFSQFPDGDGLTTMLMHSSGEWLAATSRMTPKDQTPQGQGSAITYLRRYALSSVLGLATEDDDDGNAASKAPVAAKRAPTRPATSPAFVSPAARELAAKTRIVTLVDKLNHDGPPGFASKEEKADYYADEVQRLTSLSLPLASVEELEAIGDELGKLFDNRKKNDRPCLARCGRTVSMTFSKLAYLDLKNGFIASFATFSTSF